MILLKKMRPVTLCFSGLDPSGGAGLQADIEAVAGLGGHAAVVCTALTVQDSQRVYDFALVDTDLLIAQAEAVLADLPVASVKIGMLGSRAVVEAIFNLLAKHPHIPVVLDPVLSANAGGNLAHDDLREALLKILNRTAVITPNTVELRRLANCDDAAKAIDVLTAAGAHTIWITGGHEAGSKLVNQLYIGGKLVLETSQARIDGEFHGSGCTLAASLAAAIARGLSVSEAIPLTETFVRQALVHADRPRDSGQLIPNRLAFMGQRVKQIQGIYGITDASLGDQLLSKVRQVLIGGVRVLQYRDKTTDHAKRLREATALAQLCHEFGALFIVNDDISLAQASVADGVHLGQGDSHVMKARALLGPAAIIGVTCHNDLALGREAVAAGADYIAFGAMYASVTKPHAQLCSLDILRAARAEFSLPLVAIGGISVDTIAPVRAAGADAIALISELWRANNTLTLSQRLTQEIYLR
jgi:thiamine-phosphate diphosphorylase/hydroxymethylpyrimidine kinase/phosphomethylpyrimidine kinase